MEKSKLLMSLVVIFLLQYHVTATVFPKDSKHFVLVHEACLGGWSWYKIIASLRTWGHKVTAIDLGASGINPKQVLQVSLLSDYFLPLTEFMASLPSHDKVVIVGHGLNGLAISKAMESFPEKISVAVFLTALMPGPTLDATKLFNMSASFVVNQLDNRVTFDNGPTKPPTTFLYGPKYLANNLYQLSPIEDLALATTLVRPIYYFAEEDVAKEIVLSNKRHGSVKRVFIVAAEDKIYKKEFQLMMIQKNPPNEVEEIRGSDRMTMTSKPLQLSVLLQRIANKY